MRKDSTSVFDRGGFADRSISMWGKTVEESHPLPIVVTDKYSRRRVIATIRWLNTVMDSDSKLILAMSLTRRPVFGLKKSPEDR